MKMRVLVVDDEHNMTLFLTRVLEDSGFSDRYI
jgi:DNA-binding response OmpR family regulator